MSTWGVAINMLMIEAGVEYAIEFLEGNTDGRLDEEALFSIIDGLSDGGATISKYESGGVTLDNFYMILSDFYDFAQ